MKSFIIMTLVILVHTLCTQCDGIREPERGRSSALVMKGLGMSTAIVSTASEAQGSTDPPATSSNAAFAESARTNTKSARMDAEFDQPRTSLHTASVTEAAASHNTDSTQAGEEAKTSLMAETKTTLVISPSKTASETLTTTAKCLYDPGALVGRGQTDGR
ncbi:hypothetical protein EDB81DRAFT_806399, partial [Dactylonectria macrodidyma]